MVGTTKYGETTQMVREVLSSEDRVWTYRDVENRMGECNASGILATMEHRGEVKKVGQMKVGTARLNLYRVTPNLGKVGRSGPKDLRKHQQKILESKRTPPIPTGRGILGVRVHRIGGSDE